MIPEIRQPEHGAHFSIRKVKRSWRLFAGEVVISRKFRNEAAAYLDLERHRDYYEMQAGSATVSVLNCYAKGNIKTVDCG